MINIEDVPGLETELQMVNTHMCKDSEVLAAEQFAEKFGLLFQLRDDLLDFVFTDDLAKKTIHNDFWCGYYTLPAIHSFSDGRNGAELKQIAMDIKNGLHNEVTDRRIEELISASDGFGYTLTMIDQYAKDAKQNLNVFKDSIARKKLQELVDTFQLSAHRIVSDHLSGIPLEEFTSI